MKITNKWGLPEPLVRAVSFSEYKRGTADFTVTELIKPPRIRMLERIFADELEEDASDRLWALMGSAGHEVLRRSSQGGIVEERCEVEYKGLKISGQLDYAVQDYAIFDYKFTSVWAVKDGVKKEWKEQLNVYKWMADQYGVDVRALKIIAILRDWSKPEASRDKSYPQCQVVVMPVAIWAKQEVEEWLDQRIKLHMSKLIPECTAEDTWERPTIYAVMKKGNQRASRVFTNPVDAGKLANKLGHLYSVETRPGERPRCEHYCPVSTKCSQYLEWLSKPSE